MPVDVMWDDPDHTILRVVLSDWGWEDFAYPEAIEARRAMFEGAPEPVTILILMHDAPHNLLGMLPKMAQSPGFSHPNVKQMVIVADKNIIKVAADIFEKVYDQASRRMRVVSSLNEAYRVIAERPEDQSRAAGQ